MGMFQSRHKQTKKSYLVNAVLAFLLGVFMIACIFLGEDVEAKNFIISAGIMWVMAGYWYHKHRKFDEEDHDSIFPF